MIFCSLNILECHLSSKFIQKAFVHYLCTKVCCSMGCSYGHISVNSDSVKYIIKFGLLYI